MDRRFRHSIPFLGLLLISFVAIGQKSRVMSVFQMIDQGKYEEAKEAIELAVWNDKTSRWHRTYYAKGLLCQTAYEEGYKKEDTRKTMLYPDQLSVAHKSYEKALELDVRGRLTTNIAQKYYTLANDFMRIGSDYFNRKEYEDALTAFESALEISQSNLVNVKVDTNLVYNTALAAYESKNWDKAIMHLSGLHLAAHKPSTSLLLYQAYAMNKDSARAEEVLLEAINIYDYDQQVVLYLINLLVRTGRSDKAIEVLEDAIYHQSEVARFHWGKGLIHTRTGEHEKAIESFMTALELDPEESMLYYHLGVIYYNKAIDLREASLKIKDNDGYLEMKAQIRELLEESVLWLEKSYAMDPFDKKTISRLRQLYFQLQMKEKEDSMRLLLE